MKDFVLLFKNPREIFCKDRDDTSVSIVFIIFLLLNAISIAISMGGVQSSAFGKILSKFHISVLVFVPLLVFFIWIATTILVNILSLVFRILTEKIDKTTITNKKNFKKLIYLCYLLPNIVDATLDFIHTILVKNATKPDYIEPLSQLYTAFIFSIMLCFILDHIYKAKKSSTILPIAYFVVMLISAISGLVS